jgi:hypothetical protein
VWAAAAEYRTARDHSDDANLFHSFDTNEYRIHPSFLILSFYNDDDDVDYDNNNNNNNVKIIPTIPERQTWKAGHQGTAENSHVRHCTHISESNNVKYNSWRITLHVP